MDLKIIESFCSNINALECSSALSVNYRTVSNKYHLFRQLIATYLQNLYENKAHDNSSYEEFYFFTQRQKEKKEKSLYEAINIIGFYSNGLVYTLLMPTLPKSNLEKEDKNFEKFLSWHKLQSQDAYATPLKIFWSYLEQNLKKYKGMKEENFFYYLKECEFKFNFLVHRQVEILKNLYFI
jgi:transposase-like protein